MNAELITTIVSLLVAIGSLIGVFTQRRKVRADAAAMINESYHDLCESLRSEIQALRDNAIADRKRIAELTEQVLDLQEALNLSENERTRLQKEVDELSERLARYENRPTRSRATSK